MHRFPSPIDLVLVTLVLISVLLGIAARPAHGQSPVATQQRIYLPLVVAPSDPRELMVAEVLRLTNAHRAEHGCPPVQRNPQLEMAAQRHSEDMANHDTLSHVGSDGSTPWQRIANVGYVAGEQGENIAAGQSTAQAVVDAWFNEAPPQDGHRRNILDCTFTDLGIGYVVNPASAYGSYWTQDFGGPRS